MRFFCLHHFTCLKPHTPSALCYEPMKHTLKSVIFNLSFLMETKLLKFRFDFVQSHNGMKFIHFQPFSRTVSMTNTHSFLVRTYVKIWIFCNFHTIYFVSTILFFIFRNLFSNLEQKKSSENRLNNSFTILLCLAFNFAPNISEQSLR